MKLFFRIYVMIMLMIGTMAAMNNASKRFESAYNEEVFAGSPDEESPLQVIVANKLLLSKLNRLKAVGGPERKDHLVAAGIIAYKNSEWQQAFDYWHAAGKKGSADGLARCASILLDGDYFLQCKISEIIWNTSDPTVEMNAHRWLLDAARRGSPLAYVYLGEYELSRNNLVMAKFYLSNALAKPHASALVRVVACDHLLPLQEDAKSVKK